MLTGAGTVGQAMSERTLHGEPARYAGGLHEVARCTYAWLQPNGGLGESNAGLVVGEGESLLVDTLWDLRLTRRMLAAMAPRTAGAPIRRLVMTHGDGDHCWGNQCLREDVEIVATRAGAEDMLGEDPRALRALSVLGRRIGPLARRRVLLPGSGKVAGLAAFAGLLAPFEFAGITLHPPTRTFEGVLELEVGGRRVELIEVGPAHTPGDLIVHVPDVRTVFAADLMFVGCHPIMWVGPVENWIAGLDRIAALEPEIVVPGHGPVTDLEGVAAMRRYWEVVARAARDGLPAREIAALPELAAYAGWDGPERLVVNAAMIARSDAGGTGRVGDRERTGLLAEAGELALELRG